MPLPETCLDFIDDHALYEVRPVDAGKALTGLLLGSIIGSFIIFNKNPYEHEPYLNNSADLDDLENVDIALSIAYSLNIALIISLRIIFNHKIQNIIDYNMGLNDNGGFSSTPFYTAFGFSLFTALAIRNYNLFDLNDPVNAGVHFTFPLLGMALGNAAGVLNDKLISRCGPYDCSSVRRPLLADPRATTTNYTENNLASQTGSINSTTRTRSSIANCLSCNLM